MPKVFCSFQWVPLAGGEGSLNTRREHKGMEKEEGMLCLGMVQFTGWYVGRG